MPRETGIRSCIRFGPACSCSQTLRRAGLQLLSFPFDWTGPIPDESALRMDVKRRTDLLCTEFEDWLAEGDFVYQGPHTNRMDKYVNMRLQYLFLHDFPQGVPLAESFPSIHAKYERRIARFLGDGITRIAFDYQDRTPGNGLFPKLDQTSAAVAELFTVKDYRTREEIADWRRKSRAKRYAKFGATNFLQYRLLKIKKALFGKV